MEHSLVLLLNVWEIRYLLEEIIKRYFTNVFLHKDEHCVAEKYPLTLWVQILTARSPRLRASVYATYRTILLVIQRYVFQISHFDCRFRTTYPAMRMSEDLHYLEYFLQVEKGCRRHWSLSHPWFLILLINDGPSWRQLWSWSRAQFQSS